MSECRVCEVIQQRIDEGNLSVSERRGIFAIDIPESPFEGHVMLCRKEHSVSLNDPYTLTQLTIGAVARAAKYHEDYNLVFGSNSLMGLPSDHFNLQYLPRKEDDGFQLLYRYNQADSKENVEGGYSVYSANVKDAQKDGIELAFAKRKIIRSGVTKAFANALCSWHTLNSDRRTIFFVDVDEKEPVHV